MGKGFTALSASLVLAAVAAAPATAAPAPAPVSFALAPVSSTGTFLLRTRPGASVRRAVLVRNLTRRRVTVRLQAADIRNAGNGNADYVTTGRSGAGRWVRLATRTVRLAPRATRRIAFTVDIPRSARAGSHYAGIVAVDAADLAAAAEHRRGKGSGFSFARVARQALPLTIRLPGPLTRRLTLRSVGIVVEPAGAGLMLGLLPTGSALIDAAPIELRVSRGARTIFEHESTMGQLFPGDPLDYRIAWKGTPTRGTYRIRGVIRPHRARDVIIDETIRFTPAAVADLQRTTPPAAVAPPVAVAVAPALPQWVWMALAGAGALIVLLLLLLFLGWRRRRRRPPLVAVA
jgi:hypothetical protein